MPRKVGWCLEGATQGKYIKTRKGGKKKKRARQGNKIIFQSTPD